MLEHYLGLLIGDLITGDNQSDQFLDLFLDGFSELFAWLCSFIFIDMFPFFGEKGSEVFDRVYANIYYTMATGDFIASIIGFMICIPILKLVINIMRG